MYAKTVTNSRWYLLGGCMIFIALGIQKFSKERLHSDDDNNKKKPHVLMVGVDSKVIGGMWTVAETYMNSKEFNKAVNLTYIPTSTYGSKIVRVCAMLSGYWSVFVKLMTGHIDVVHIHMAEKGSTYRKGAIVHMAHFFRKKIVIQMHAGPFMKFYATQGPKRQRWIRNMFAKADYIMALGEYWKGQLYDLVPSEKLRILYNGTYCPDLNLYNPDGKKILYLGLMKQTKGTFDLLNALHGIDDTLDPSIQVCLCGLAEDDGIEKKIKELGLENRVKMLGWITKEQRLELFKDTLMIVHPSWFEALSMTVLEAVAYGIPVVTTNISTMPEILGPDVETVPVKDPEALGNLILKWADDPVMREEISKKLYDRAKKMFSVEQNIRNTLQIYKDVLKKDE